ncbi:hypothetical protein C0989_004000 [Termitomyces sp. Mn162]|nr:hypothetical protein C0989_004000 [Termitomyces sp. Mn162]KAH0585679.1 hypothetical protein H2248_008890 [Termitomyces sp. 'cryptogamus']
MEQEAEVIQPLTEANQPELKFFKEVCLSPPMNFPEFPVPIGNAGEHLEVLRISKGPWKYLGNGLFHALESLLKSMQPYPGDPTNILQYQGPQFYLMQISDEELVVMDMVLDTDDLLSMDAASNPNFEIGLWFAELWSETLGEQLTPKSWF